MTTNQKTQTASLTIGFVAVVVVALIVLKPALLFVVPFVGLAAGLWLRGAPVGSRQRRWSRHLILISCVLVALFAVGAIVGGSYSHSASHETIQRVVGVSQP